MEFVIAWPNVVVTAIGMTLVVMWLRRVVRGPRERIEEPFAPQERR